ncbi:hypothetical protein NMY22_g11796 [Coprinellus aureogranulatus]|nr:hypothetical protein NMY22_g11796 [Coprinellus aureogranulatus]
MTIRGVPEEDENEEEESGVYPRAGQKQNQRRAAIGRKRVAEYEETDDGEGKVDVAVRLVLVLHLLQLKSRSFSSVAIRSDVHPTLPPQSVAFSHEASPPKSKATARAAAFHDSPLNQGQASLSSLNPRGASVLGGQKLKERWRTYDDNEGADEGGGDVDIKGDGYEGGEGAEDEESDIEHESPESDEVSQVRSFPPLPFPQLRFDSRLPRIPVTVRLTVR